MAMSDRERQDRLARYFAGRYLDPRVGGWQEISGGWETDLYAFELEHGPPQARQTDRLVIRVFHGPEARSRAQHEYRVMRSLGPLGIPTPQVWQPAGDASDLGDPFILMEWIPGPTLLQRLLDSPAADRGPLARRMVEILLRIHQVDWTRVFPEPVRASMGLSGPLAYVDSVLAEMRTTLSGTGLTDFAPLLSWLEERRSLGGSDRLSVLHNDFHPENILMRDGELVVLDWSFASVGDYRMDLAWTALLLGAMLGEEYRGVLLRAYEQLAGAPVRDFEYFEALKLGTRMITIGSWLAGPEQTPVHKITREAIRGGYRVHVLNPYRRLKQITGIALPSIESL
jgi:aminoglycoside phosphotransferase (APT) family kinase protein